MAPPAASIERSCSDPKSQIRMSCPVAAVMTAFKAFFCIIGDFVAVIAMLRKKTPCFMIHLPVLIFIRKSRKFSLQRSFLQRRSILQNQTVCRDMLRRKCRGLPKRLHPLIDVLAGKSRNKIQTDVIKACPSRIQNTLPCFFRRMDSAKEL